MKKVLITGAGSGLGAELAKCYSEQGDHIILVGRNEENLKNVSNSIVEKGFSAEYFVTDITKQEQMDKLKQSIREKHSQIDCLINNAGVGYFGAIEKLTVDEMNAMIDVNVKGTIMVTTTLLPYTRERILNIISTAGLRGKINEAVYCASKFAIRGFTESLQKELAENKIRLTAVYMGGMDTPFWENSTHIKDKSRLKSAKVVAKEIFDNDDGREEIIVY